MLIMKLQYIHICSRFAGNPKFIIIETAHKLKFTQCTCTYKFIIMVNTVKPVLSSHSKRRSKIVFFKANYRLMQVKSIAECSKGSILQILSSFIKLPFVIMIFVLSIFELPLKTGFTVHVSRITLLPQNT